MSELNPSSKAPGQRLPLPPYPPAKREPTRSFLAGYVLDNKVAVKLNCAIAGVPIPPTREGHYLFPLLPTIETSITKDLRSKGFDFRVDVSFVGAETPLSTILAAQGNYEFRGPPPKVVE